MLPSSAFAYGSGQVFGAGPVSKVLSYFHKSCMDDASGLHIDLKNLNAKYGQ